MERARKIRVVSIGITFLKTGDGRYLILYKTFKNFGDLKNYKDWVVV